VDPRATHGIWHGRQHRNHGAHGIAPVDLVGGAWFMESEWVKVRSSVYSLLCLLATRGLIPALSRFF
jgi:hypothetical protein